MDRLVLLLWCGFLFFYGLGTGELWRTESLRAQVAAECLQRGDWLLPTLYGQPLFTKPPGIYVAIAAVSWPVGTVREWTARLPSALAATATVFLFYGYFSRQLGRRAGLVAALILPLSVVWLEKAPSAEIDMLQVFWVSAAMIYFLCALEREEAERGALAWWLLALLCVAGGVLTKWTAPTFFYAAVIPLLWWRGRMRLLFGWRHLLSAGIGATFCLSWITFAAQRGGWDEFITAVGREATQHLSPAHRLETVQTMPGHEHLNYWSETLLHPLKVLAMNLPWSALALLTLRPSFFRLWDERGQRLLQALHCWVWPNLLLWSLLPQHSTRHSMPLFPGIAGLAALVWVAWMEGRLSWRAGSLDELGALTRPRSPGWLLASLVIAWLGVKLAFVHAVLPQRVAAREPRAKGEQLAALVPHGHTLFLGRVKDEGIMFYYARPVRRLASWGELPSNAEPTYCILEEAEWRQWPTSFSAEIVQRLRDEQGAPLVLVRVRRK